MVALIVNVVVYTLVVHRIHLIVLPIIVAIITITTIIATTITIMIQIFNIYQCSIIKLRILVWTLMDI